MQQHVTARDKPQDATLLMCQKFCHLLVNRAHHVVNHWKPTDCIQKMHIWPKQQMDYKMKHSVTTVAALLGKGSN